MADAGSNPITDYIDWDVSPERQRHDWSQARRAIVRTRIIIVLAGHAAFLVVCQWLKASGALSGGFVALGWWSLLVVSACLLMLEFLHVRARPRERLRFVVRNNGVTAYDADGPRAHWDWSRTCLLSLETDRERPDYRNLVLGLQADAHCLNRFFRCAIPLPEAREDAPDEVRIVAAVKEALAANHIELRPLNKDSARLVRVAG